MGAPQRRVGIIARCDQGGLANQTYELANHLQPERVLLVRMNENSRGIERPERYRQLEGVSVTEVDYRHVTPGLLYDFARDVDTVLTSETWYTEDAVRNIHAGMARAVLIAMPELYVDDGEDEVIVPTDWELGRFHTPPTLLPHPVALDRFPEWTGPRAECHTFYHPAAPAMLDRNGTELVLRACPYVEEECTVFVRSDGPPPKALGLRQRSDDQHDGVVGRVTVEWVEGRSPEYWEQYPAGCDALLLPRRYAGMCLPAQESAALGWPMVTLDVAPQNSWPHTIQCTAHVKHQSRMKGGSFNVHDADPRHLARAMDDLIQNPGVYAELSVAARQWAEERSWTALLPAWNALLR